MFTFLLIWTGCILIYSFSRKWENLGNVDFWLLVWWALVLGITITTNVKWIHKPSIISYGYFTLCFVIFYVGRVIGKKTVQICDAKEEDIPICQLHIYKYIAFIGLAMFVFDYVRINGLGYSTRTYEISFIGALGNLVIPILLPLGLYELGNGIKNVNKLSLGGIVSLLGYALPGLISHGRESVVFVGIAAVAVISMCMIKSGKGLSIAPKYRKYIVMCGLAGALIFYFLLQRTRVRFTANDVSTFVYYHPLPESSKREVQSWGVFSTLYYALAWYFGTQLPYLEFILRRYTGPFVIGAYEFNIISRRFPASWKLNTAVVSSAQRVLFKKYGESFNALWPGFAGTLIFDFGKIGTIIVILFIGIFVGKIIEKSKRTNSLRYQVEVALLCMMTFTTIQMGPLFQYNVWSTLMWWSLMFGNKRIRFTLNGLDM
ncbi:Uncharacterised protein [uncultured Clostridium sp.]|nr:Uncharacterised protein [uncultured Clostridium sp.]